MTELPDDQRLKDGARRYLDTVNLNDADQVAALYHPDGTLEDPVGSGTAPRGRENIRSFYRMAFSAPIRVELDDEPWGSFGNAAAYVFRVFTRSSVIRVVGVLTFDDEGLITSMRAYYGPSDRSPA